jgi:hypothetical protein
MATCFGYISHLQAIFTITYLTWILNVFAQLRENIQNCKNCLKIANTAETRSH